jgi:glycosyltransferase involved in cell wall biosynthesis
LKTSVLVPVFNEARNIPTLLRALALVQKKAKDLEIIFVDNGSTDGSPEMLEAAKLPGSRLVRESRRGFAEPLNRGLAEASGDLLLFLDADAVPEPGWAVAMERALATSDLVVGDTVSLPPKKKTPYSQVSAKLFEGHSERTAHARGHALPWGPTCNLGVRRALMEKTGPFSPEATSAFDIDWCWRAMLKGARIAFVKEARVKHARRSERRALLEQFERYGLGEAWLHRTYAFLLSPEDQAPDPLLSGVDAFRRLRYLSDAAKVKALTAPLEEVAAAFAGGVRLGYERPHRECPIERSAPEGSVSWWNGPKAVTVFVPGKGLAVLEGKQLQLWQAMQAGDDDAALTKLFMKLFRAKEHDAHHEVEAFRSSLSP